MTISSHTAAAFIAALCLGAAGSAVALGSGASGGGQTPSVTQPQYDPALEYQRGKDAYAAGDYKEAAKAFANVTDAQPEVAAGWLMLGEARLKAGDAKGAARALTQALRRDSGSIDAQRDLVVALAQSNQTDKARAELAKLKLKADACGPGCSQMAEYTAAIQAGEAALAGGGPHASRAPMPLDLAGGDIAYVRAVSLINEHRYAEAMTSLREAETAFGPHPDILTYEGYVWRKLGDWGEAERHYRAALALAPDHRGATEYYGELKVLRGDLTGARSLLAKLDAACAYGCVEAEDLRRWVDKGGDPGF